MSTLVSEIWLAGAVLAGSPDVQVRATETRANPETVSALSRATIEGLSDSGVEASSGEPWADDCSDDACVREAMIATSARAVVVLSLEQHDNVYAFELEARNATTGERLANAEDTCEICGLEEVSELVRLRAAAIGTRLAEPHVGTVRITSEPAGAVIYIDDRNAGTTPTDLELTEGAHTIRIEKRGFLPDRRSIEVRPGMEQDLRIPMVAEVSKDRTARRWFIAGGVSLGVGVVGVAAGIPFVLLDDEPYEANCRADADGNCAKLYDTMGAGASLLTAGAIGLAAGTAMILIGRKHRQGRAKLEARAGGVAVRF